MNKRQQLEAIRKAGLNNDEIWLLSRIVFDGVKQHVVARELGVDQGTVSRAMAGAIEKLNNIGLHLRDFLVDKKARRKNRPFMRTANDEELLSLEEQGEIKAMW